MPQTLTVRTVPLDDTGLDMSVAYVAAQTTNSFANPANRQALVFVKTATTATVFTIPNQKTLPAYASANSQDISISLAASEEKCVGAIPADFEDGNKLVEVSFSEPAGVQIAVIARK